MPHSLVEVYQRSRGTCSLLLTFLDDGSSRFL